jgi:hypothetical protein
VPSGSLVRHDELLLLLEEDTELAEGELGREESTTKASRISLPGSSSLVAGSLTRRKFMLRSWSAVSSGKRLDE